MRKRIRNLCPQPWGGSHDRHAPVTVLVCFVCALGGCEPASPAGAADSGRLRPTAAVGAGFNEVFELERVITLEEPDSALITGIAWLAVSPDGRLAIPDAMESQVRVYGSDGRLLANLGRRGQGPGEFQGPRYVAFAEDGALYVAEGASPRITRFTPSLELDTTLLMPGAQLLHGLVALPQGFAAGHVRFSPAFAGVRDSGFVNVYDGSGQRRTSFYRVPEPIFEVPYWFSATLNMGTSGYVFAAQGERVVVGTSLLYPLAEFTVRGELIDSIGHPPPSWTEASQPKRGAFPPPNQMAKFQPWLRSFTTIHRVALLEGGWLLVVHRRLDPEVLAYEEPSYAADVYDEGRRKVWEEIPLPGDLLAAAGRRAYVLAGGAPDEWRIAVYAMRR